MNLLHCSRMKCPLGSTNKRFLLNTLGPCAAEHPPGSPSATLRRVKDNTEDGGRRSRQHHHHTEDREPSYKKDIKDRREHPHSYSQSSRHHDSSISQLASTGHALRHGSQSNRTRSRSPVREHPTTKRSSDRTRKWCIISSVEWNVLSKGWFILLLWFKRNRRGFY